ncbi:MAG: hypothetical protein K9N07_10195 [Candidatus Cloacimonetes bacterium]|nr:hypothetical protein [Candidatus Cloacimonadota bacterium]
MNLSNLFYGVNESKKLKYLSKNMLCIQLLLIIQLLITTGCVSNVNTKKNKDIERAYPRWFANQADNPEAVVGFSRNGKGLLRDAEIRYCAYHKGFSIKGVLYIYPRGDYNFADYHFCYKQEELDNIRDNLVLLDQFSTNLYTGDNIACYSPKDSNVVIDKEYILYSELIKPQWVKKYSENSAFISGGYCYGIGKYPFWGNENDSWITAEEKALKQIASYVANHVIDSKTNFETNNEDIYDHVIGIYFNHQLEDVLVCERWLDLSEKMVYVLVKVKKDDIKYEFE